MRRISVTSVESGVEKVINLANNAESRQVARSNIQNMVPDTVPFVSIGNFLNRLYRGESVTTVNNDSEKVGIRFEDA